MCHQSCFERPQNNTRSCQAEWVSTYSEGCHHPLGPTGVPPPCCCFSNLPQLWLGEAAELRLFISSLFQGRAGSICPQGGWHSCRALIFMLNVFSFASRDGLMEAKTNSFLQLGAWANHIATSEEFRNPVKTAIW